MKLIIYMAISIDGLITRNEADSDWVSQTDWDQLDSYIKASDAVIMGRKTMEQFGNDFPIEGTFNVVLSSNPALHKNSDSTCIISATPQEIVAKLQSKGYQNLLLIGGANTNRQFLKAGLVDEIVLSVHPLVIGKGLRLFGDELLDVHLKLVSTKIIENELVQIVYLNHG